MPVCFDKQRGKYRASISHNYKKYHTKYFADQRDAEVAFKELRTQIEERFQVDLSREPKPYPANIIVNGLNILIGRFKTKAEADAAYEAKKAEVKEAEKDRDSEQERLHPQSGPGKIPLRDKKGNIVAWTIVSLDDEAAVRKYRWYLGKIGNIAYARGFVDGIHIRLHSFICGDVIEKQVIDHINGNTLDNRRENLRSVTQRENARNRSNQDMKKSRHGFFGVTQNSENSFSCRVRHIVYKSFSTALEAAQEFDRVMLRLDGPTAKTNDALSTKERQTLLDVYASDGPQHPQVVKEQDYYFLKDDVNQTKIFQSFSEAFEHYISLQKRNKIENYTSQLRSKRLQHASDMISRNAKGDAIIRLCNKDKIVIAEALVDDDLWREINLHKWHLDTSGYVSSNMTDLGPIRLHQFVWRKSGKEVPAGHVIDHVLHGEVNRRNCKLANLRLNTHSGNSQNKAARNKFKGVQKKNGNSWNSKICVNGKVYYLGNFSSEIDAAKAYDTKAKEMHGDCASLNFPILHS